MTRVNANLVEWIDQKGYGFAREAGGTERIFVHAKAFSPRNQKPQKGDEIELEIVPGRDGRPAAKDVRVLNEKDIARQLPLHLVTSAVLLILVHLVVIIGRAPFALLAIYAVMGGLSLYLYSRDKKAAVFGWWRISENRLLVVDFLFGIIGGLLAQHRYRHKKSKQTYQARTMVIVAVHALFLAGLGSGLLNWDSLFGAFLPLSAAQ